jgi:hypothetical protein
MMSRARYRDRPYDDAASALWDLTQTDWYVTVEHIITEPTCAYVSLRADDEAMPTLTNFIGTGDINDSVRRACEYHLETLRKHLAATSTEER